MLKLKYWILPTIALLVLIKTGYNAVYGAADSMGIVLVLLLLLLSSVVGIVINVIRWLCHHHKESKAWVASCIISLLIISVWINWGVQLKHYGLVWRIQNEEKFAACKEKARSVNKEGVFNICETHDISAGIPAPLNLEYIVYDTTKAFDKQNCNAVARSLILKTTELKNVGDMPFYINSLSYGFYLISVSSNSKGPGDICK